VHVLHEEARLPDGGDAVDDVQHTTQHQENGRKQGPAEASHLVHSFLPLSMLR
jgi:hypothetical protein